MTQKVSTTVWCRLNGSCPLKTHSNMLDVAAQAA